MRILKIVVYFSFFSFFLIPSLASAQDPGCPDLDLNGVCDTEQDPDNSVPLDGGLSILLAAGISYGVKKTYDARKKQSIN